MNAAEEFHKLSYSSHENQYKLPDNQLNETQQSYFRKDTVDYWRHNRMYNLLTPLLNHHPESSWLTIGDGKFGLDSIKIKHLAPSVKILPTDISEEFLLYSKNEKWIENYSKENAEMLSFSDNSFDFSFCKESYHHFPRPYIALYEMIRVSKKAVVLIEPYDHFNKPVPLQFILNLKKFIKRIFGKKTRHWDTWSYEITGNYVFSISKREIEKVALGLNFPFIAYYYFNDYYEPGIEFEKAEPKSALFNKVKNKIRIRDLGCRLGLGFPSHIFTILFKESPSKVMIKSMKEAGIRVVELPRNPYV